MPCEPGACFSYSHANYVILGEILARAAGKPVEALIRERILDPLQLADTRSEDTAAIQLPVLHAFTAERGIREDTTYRSEEHTSELQSLMRISYAVFCLKKKKKQKK